MLEVKVTSLLVVFLSSWEEGPDRPLTVRGVQIFLQTWKDT